MIRIKRNRFGVICSLLLDSFLAAGLAASTAAPALAGSGGFSNTGSMNFARHGHTAPLLSNGQVLAAGGMVKRSNGTFDFTNTAELYTP